MEWNNAVNMILILSHPRYNVNGIDHSSTSVRLPEDSDLQ